MFCVDLRHEARNDALPALSALLALPALPVRLWSACTACPALVWYGLGMALLSYPNLCVPHENPPSHYPMFILQIAPCESHVFCASMCVEKRLCTCNSRASLTPAQARLHVHQHRRNQKSSAHAARLALAWPGPRPALPMSYQNALSHYLLLQ